MYIVTTEVAPHVRVSKTLDRVSHYSREPRAHKTERRRLNKHAQQAASTFSSVPRLVKPSEGLQVIDLQHFLHSTPASQLEEISLTPAAVLQFDKRAAVAQAVGL